MWRSTIVAAVALESMVQLQGRHQSQMRVLPVLKVVMELLWACSFKMLLETQRHARLVQQVSMVSRVAGPRENLPQEMSLPMRLETVRSVSPASFLIALQIPGGTASGQYSSGDKNKRITDM